MTITIKCNKCGKESYNTYFFEEVSFSYLNKESQLRNIHLCSQCQKVLLDLTNATVAKFIGEESVRDWNRHKGVL
jgi:hypothetical protein